MGVVGGAVLLALSFAVVSLWLSLRSGSSADLEARINALRTEVSDLFDRVEQWQKRDRVRRVREAKEDGPPEVAPPNPASSRLERLRALRSVPRSNLRAN